jgi:hypothetical protein
MATGLVVKMQPNGVQGVHPFFINANRGLYCRSL